MKNPWYDYLDIMIRDFNRMAENLGSIVECDLPAQLAECALQFERVWEEKTIDFDADLEDEAFITADSSLMELVWNNLHFNALKLTEADGRQGVGIFCPGQGKAAF